MARTIKASRLAAQFARNIIEHERRNDHGGTYHQNVREFGECTARLDDNGNVEYQLPLGTHTKFRAVAVEAWAKEGR